MQGDEAREGGQGEGQGEKGREAGIKGATGSGSGCGLWARAVGSGSGCGLWARLGLPPYCCFNIFFYDPFGNVKCARTCYFLFFAYSNP